MKGKDLYALLPCPVKTVIESEFSEYVKELEQIENSTYDYLIEANANKNMAKHNYMDDYKTLDDIPSIVISSGINDFYSKDFYNHFIANGQFCGKFSKEYSNKLIDSFAKDPDYSYNIIAMNFLVMVVDLTKIGNRKIPSGFEDILDCSFRNSIAMRGKNNKYCETTLLAIFKEYGMEGIKCLKENVMGGYHPAEMVKMAGKNFDNAPVVSILPYYYANLIQNKEKVKIVWPKEGAIVSPITMLVKKDCEKKIQKIAEFFVSDTCVRLFSKANFITLSDEDSNNDLKDKKYYWPGWEFIHKNDIKKLIDELNAVMFM